MADESRESSPLDGFVAVVTGAAQGLGLAIAERLANDGAGVFLADLQFEKAEAEALQLRQKGLDATAAELDVSDIAAVEGFFEGLGARGKGVDILVNSAGVGQKVLCNLPLFVIRIAARSQGPRCPGSLDRRRSVQRLRHPPVLS